MALAMAQSEQFGPEDDLDNYRILDAAETLVTLQSVQQEQQLQQLQQLQQQQQPQQPLAPVSVMSNEGGGGGLLFLSTTPPLTSVGSLSMSPLGSPMLHQLSSAYLDEPKSSLAANSGLNHHVSFLVPRNSSLNHQRSQSNQGMHHPPIPDDLDMIHLTPSHSTSNGGDDAFDLSLGSPRLMGPPPIPSRFDPVASSSSPEMMKPPPNPPPPGRRGRGARGRGTPGPERGTGGGRGRGRGRGRGAKSQPPPLLPASPDGLGPLDGLGGSDDGDSTGDSLHLAPACGPPPADAFAVGHLNVSNSVFDDLLNARKLELFHDPEIQRLLQRAPPRQRAAPN